jgi:hypothetical protein
MYVGSNVHLNEEGRLLCSFSLKTCNQRRMDGYAFCIKHVLEVHYSPILYCLTITHVTLFCCLAFQDKSAPFKQCSYISTVNRRRCSNPIPISHTSRLYYAFICMCANVDAHIASLQVLQ